MADYTELAKELRYCVDGDKECAGCKRYGQMSCEVYLMEEAADTIEELQQTVEHYKGCSDDWYKEACDYKAMLPRWIPVTERLPEEDGDYLVWYLIEDGCEPWFAIFPFDSNVPAFGYWDEDYDPVTYGWAGSDFIEVKGVTHWMPLPEPPKEETE